MAKRKTQALQAPETTDVPGPSDTAQSDTAPSEAPPTSEPVQETVPPAPAPEDKPPADGNGNGQPNGPVESFSVLVAKDIYVRATIWARKVVLRGGEQFVTHEVSVNKRYKDGASGEWKTSHSFRGSELYALAHVLRRAEEYILNLRTMTRDFPF